MVADTSAAVPEGATILPWHPRKLGALLPRMAAPPIALAARPPVPEPVLLLLRELHTRWTQQAVFWHDPNAQGFSHMATNLPQRDYLMDEAARIVQLLLEVGDKPTAMKLLGHTTQAMRSMGGEA